MKPEAFFRDIVDPSLKRLTEWTGLVSDDRARVLVMAIAGQESNWRYRLQSPVPYARSYWQFELGGAVRGVLTHPASADRIRTVCRALDLICTEEAVYDVMAWNETLACCMARLLLWTDPRPLPAVGERELAWNYYCHTWNPGAPHPERWAQNYAIAKALVGRGTDA